MNKEKKSYDLPQESMEVHQVGSGKRGNVTCRFVVAVIAAVLGSFQFGYGIGIVSNIEKSIRNFINETEYERTGEELSDNQITNLWSLAVSIWAVGGCIGGFFGGWVAKVIGRKRGSLANSVYGIVCSALLFSSKRAETFELFIGGRFLIGINCGVYTAITPMYLSEISSVNIRGAVGVLHQLAVVTGLLTGQVLGFHVILGDEDWWDVLVGLHVVPCLGQLFLMTMSPESPRHLMISKNDEKASRKSLIALRGQDDVDDELEEIKNEMRSQSTQQVSVIQLFTKPSLRMPLIIGIVMHCSQQLCGINGVFFYSTTLFEESGLSATSATYTTAAVGAIMLVMTLVTVPLIDKAGRRTFQLIGLGGMAVSGILVTIALNLRHTVDEIKYVAVVITLCYVVFFALGPGSIPWLIVAELFSHEARSAALSVCVLVNWTCSFTIGYIFPFVQEGLKDYTFVPFTVIIVVIFIFTFFKLPETKGKTFEEVSAIWQEKQYDGLVKGNIALAEPDSGGHANEAINSKVNPNPSCTGDED